MSDEVIDLCVLSVDLIVGKAYFVQLARNPVDLPSRPTSIRDI